MDPKRTILVAIVGAAASLTLPGPTSLPAAEPNVTTEAQQPRTPDARAGKGDRAADDQYAVAAGHYRDRRWQLAADEFKAFSARHAADARVVKARFFRGEALAQLDQLSAAESEFAQVLSSEPEGRYARQALFRSAECALLAGNVKSAATLFEKFGSQYPDDELTAHVLAYQADLALAAKDFATAQKQYSAALARKVDGPLAADCQLGIARAQHLQGDHRAAAEAYRKLAAGEAGPADKALYYLADLHLAAGEHEAAECSLAELSQKYPLSALLEQSAILRAVALRHLSRFADADALLTKIEAVSPLYIEAQYGLGLSQKAQQHYEQSAKLLLAAVPAKPHRLSAALHFEAGDALLLAGQLDAAAAQFDIVLKNWPDSDLGADALLGKLQVALAQYDHSQAISLTDQFLQRYPDSSLGAEVRLTRATLLVKQGDRGEAEAALEKLTGNPQDATQPAALATLVMLQIQKKDLAAAAKSLSQLRTASPQHPRLAPLSYQLAEAAYTAEQYDQAAENFQLVVDDAPTGDLATKAASGLGWAQFQTADYAAAAASFGRFLEKYPQDKLASEAALVRGQSLEKLGQLDGALSAYHQLLEKYPESIDVPAALWRAGRLHQRLQQSREATAMFAALVDKHPTASHAAAALYHWGWLEHDAGNLDHASELWSRVRKEYPESRLWPDSTYRLAERALTKRDFAAAETLAAEVIAAQPAPDLIAHGLFLQARIAIAQGQWSKVAAPLEQLLAAHADSTLALTARFWIAEATYRQGKYDEALQLHTALVRDGRAHQEKWLPTASLRCAQALAQLGRWPEALDAAQAIEKSHPDFAERYEVDYLIGRCLASQADFDGARTAYKKVLESDSGGKTETAAMAQWMIGESYFHQENYPAALREYLRVDILFAYPQWQASALLQAGKCHELAFEWKDAIELYSRILKNFPESALAEEAERRLEIAQERAKNNRRT